MNWQAVQQVTVLIRPRWAPAILAELDSRPQRYGDLLRGIDQGLSDKMLADTLRHMVSHGLVRHPDTATGKPYVLTPLGQSLLGPLGALEGWYDQHHAELSRRRSSQ